MTLIPIYLQFPCPINKTISKAVNIAMSSIGLYAEEVEGDSQLFKVEITHELDTMQIIDEMEDMEIEFAIYEGYPKEDLSNQIF